MDWTQDEQRSLLEKVRKMVGDKFSFSCAKSKVHWEKLDLNGRSPKECEEMFNTLTVKVRKYRLFSEIIEEASSEIVKGYSLKFCQEHFPDFPKRPANPTNLFVSDNPAEFKNVANKDLFRVMSQKWKDLSEEKREYYKKKYHKKKKKYDKKIEEFKKNHPAIMFRKSNSTSPRLPVPALPNPVLIYTKNVQAKVQSKHPELNAKELNQKCISKYHKLSDGKKLKWILQAQEQLPDYEVQCEMYKKEKPEAKLKPPILHLSKEDKEILHRHEGKPTAPPNNVFRFFCGKTKLESNLSLTERSKELSKLYHQLSSTQLDQLKEEYQQAVRTYIDKFSKFYDSLPLERQQLEETNVTALAHFKKIIYPSSNPKKRKATPGEVQKPAKRMRSKQLAEELQSDQNSSQDEFENGSSVKKEEAAAKSNSSPSTETTASSSAKSPRKKKSPKKQLNGDLDDALHSFSSPDITSTQKKAAKVASEKELDSGPKQAKKSPLSVSSLFAAGNETSGKSKKDKSASRFQKTSEDSGKSNLDADGDDVLAGFFSPLNSSRPEKESPSKSKKSKKSKKEV